MSTKLVVSIRPFHRTTYAYEKLQVCTRCGQYTCLWEDECTACGRGTLISVQAKATSRVKRRIARDLFITLLFGTAATYFGEAIDQTMAAASVSLLLLALLIFMQKRSFEVEQQRELKRTLQQDEELIRQGINRNWALVAEARKQDEALAYEMLREIGSLVYNDRIRLQQVALLQSFVLRSDMDLQLKPLLLHSFERLLAEYIGEIARLKPDLIREDAIRYIATYEVNILQLHNGIQILTAVAAAAVRKSKYIELFPSLITRYARFMPKDRFMRLYHTIERYPSKARGGLAESVGRVYNEKYRDQYADVQL
ncbi:MULTISPECIES: hypothetical protein [unclassified Paenibacillus]|uniref:hypothetical protein n=1 Tax=unclassified Paenibacillus TaxID=185978 RepID=UPI000CFD770F|nr:MULTISPECIES: hypothetical protein [unclassified Paenibacillus]MBD8840548.1 hypothetical protein [Paenibacillus sp. CFBP 13594]PRA03508.1 hypothetical protein CQ043_18430 [Paenibacillus sp. MYb63]PRA46926.1 hypothetical protein CQ061_16695 [Paenibacillus sp. MYb67]QZN76681.1 hypothetical protein K5K90_05310 [Paenibacillus sp. DR312]